MEVLFVIVVLIIIPSIISYLLRRSVFLSFLPSIFLIFVTLYFLYNIDKNIKRRDMHLSGFYAMAGGMILYVLIFVIIINIVANVIINISYRMSLRDKHKIGEREEYEKLNGNWECPSCKKLNANSVYTCSECGYKVV